MDKDMIKKYLPLLKEFIRYVIVGGISFLVDWGVLALLKEFVFRGGAPWELFLCTALGFVAGLITNYILSLVFVFKSGENKSDGKSVKGFIVFTLVGIIGLGLTELGMYTGVYLLHLHYMFTKIVVAGLVLVWNYVGRKIFVFGKG
ncbi:MAG: GtrA family protein [Oscillospiraceae bacterium]|nr:GtrA family protein [Oscillospiraceae bacterium]